MSGTRPPSNLPDESQQWRRSLEEDIEALKRQQGIDATNNAAARQTQGSIASAIARANLGIADQAEAIQDARRIPAAPNSPSVSTDAYFDEYGTPRAKVSASCSSVIQDTKGAPIDVAYHELFGRPAGTSGTAWQKLAETYTLPPAFEFSPLPAGETWDFSMGAVSAVGVAGERSATVTAVLAKDTSAPPKPSKPGASSRLGQVMINWDGKAADGSSQPADFSHAEVFMATSLAAAGLKVGTIDKDGDTFYAPEIPYNTTRWYYLIAVDVAGNRSPASDRADVKTLPLVDTDLIGRVIDGANVKLESIQSDVLGAKAVTEAKISDAVNAKIATAVSDAATANTNATTALTAANGKNKIIFSTSPASGTAYVNGDTWFQRTGGLIIAQWEFGAGQWAPRTLDNAIIANLNAGKITAGLLDADRIGANTITAEKLIIGDFTNLIPNAILDGVVSNVPASWSRRSGASTASAVEGTVTLPGRAWRTSGIGTEVSVQSGLFEVTPGGEFAVGIRSQNRLTGSTDSPAFVRMVWMAKDRAAISSSQSTVPFSTGFESFAYTFTAPADAYYAQFVIIHASPATGGSWYSGNYYVRAKATGELIVDGAITADKIATNAVEAGHIKAGAVVAGKIAANSVGANEVIANSLTANEIAANAITASELAALSVAAGHVQANAITADKVDAGAITTVKLAAGAVTADKVTARAISADKLTLGNTMNLIDDPGFDTPIGQVWNTTAGSWSIISTGSDGRSLECFTKGGYSLIQNGYSPTPVVAGETYQLFARIYKSLSEGDVRVQVSFLDESGASVQNQYLVAPSASWTENTRECVAPAGAFSMRVRCEVVSTTTATTGRAIFTKLRLIRKATAELIVDGAVTAEKISADAIDGKTITGALIRSAATAARTEMNSSGIRVLNSSNQDLVRIGYGTATGIQVRNPSTGALVSLADAAFGLVSASAANAISYNAACSPDGVQSGIGRLSGDGCVLTFTAVSSSYVIDFSETWTIGYFDPLGITVVPFVGLRVNGTGVSSGGERVMSRSNTDLAAWNPTGWRRVTQARGAVRISTTPGSTYTLDMDFSTYGVASGSANAAITLRDRFITATPVFQ